MPPVPKHRTSHGRHRRRASHNALHLPHLVLCPRCHKPALPHRVCPECGYYRDMLVVPEKKEAKKK